MVFLSKEASICDRALQSTVDSSLKTNFFNLRQSNLAFDLVFAIDMSSSKMTFEAVSLKPDSSNLNNAIEYLNNLKDDPKARLTGQRITELVKLVDNKPEVFDRLILSTDKNGNQFINVTIATDKLLSNPRLASKLGINLGATVSLRGAHSQTEGDEAIIPTANLLNRRSLSFTINTQTGSYNCSTRWSHKAICPCCWLAAMASRCLITRCCRRRNSRPRRPGSGN